MKLIRPAAAAGSRITVYLPGSSALASADSVALRMAMRMSWSALKSAASFRLRPTQPEPRPSSVRPVQVESKLVVRW
ncbi:hypothetical protein G6F40_017312 [Rhizopus arrhizus]|nr:hypothetical protein G6F40_017312 [Rhizopus arrhizus]